MRLLSTNPLPRAMRLRKKTAVALYVVFLLLCSNIVIWAQNVSNNIISGIVYKKNTGNAKIPVPAGASVYIPGVATSTTDNLGQYSLNLSQCKECKVGKSLKIYVNSAIGYAEREYTIPSTSEPVNIEVSENKKLALNGIVRDKKTGKFLKGIKVSVVIQNLDYVILPATTNEDGTFQIIIRKDGLDMPAIQMLFSDPDQNKYKDLEKVVFINQYEPIKVDLEECLDCGAIYKMEVIPTGKNSESFYDQSTKSNIKVEVGDLVTVKASGQIDVGMFVGVSGPEGRPTGVGSFSLKFYNLAGEFKYWNHAVLFYRFGEDDKWKYYDEKKDNIYVAQTNGFVEFGINDKKQSDNTGAYQVEVIVRR